MAAAWASIGGCGAFAQSGPATEGGAGRTRGPVFVPSDSWIYPALLRLAALGYISHQAAGIRPWTRAECLRQVLEARRTLSGDRSPASSREAAQLIDALYAEFKPDGSGNTFVEIESLYTRGLAIAGKPLVDGYNFGQTVIDDYGRPEAQGFNTIAGISAEAGAGRFSAYVRAEYWNSPSFTSPAASLQPLDPQIEPVLPGAVSGVSRLEPMEYYVGVQLGKWSLTAGKQELWWGPGVSGPLSFSDNAPPFYSFRVTTSSPLALPGVLRKLGSFLVDLVGGELSGHNLPPRPLMNGQKFTWIPFSGLELGFTRWSLFGGAGTRPFTLGTVWRNFTANGATFGNAVDPGDRKSGFDFLWRPPLPGAPFTLYADFYADDEPNPLTNLTRSGFAPGIYVPKLPVLPKWDLRVEVPSMRMVGTDQGGTFLYWNNVYRDANTNEGYLLGSWVGRDGRGLFLQSTWWRSARSKIDFGYRQNRIGSAFLPGGGSQDDAWTAAAFHPAPHWTVEAKVQYERYFIPLLGGIRRDVAASLELDYAPHWRPFDHRKSPDSQ